MKEMFSISSGVDVAQAKLIQVSTSDTATNTESSSSKDFLSVMFAQIKESLDSNTNQNLNIKLDDQIATTEENIVTTDLSSEGTEKSVDDHLLDDLLKITSLLKNETNEKVSFPSFSNKIEKLINNKAALKELKEVKNITDLLSLSKKYDLGLEKISVQKLDLETLKTNFPTLDKKFFETSKETSNKTNTATTIEGKKEAEIKPTVLSINNIEKPIQETKKEPSLLEKMMSSTKTSENKETVATPVVKEAIKAEETTAKIAQDVKKTINVVQEEAPKIIVKDEQKELKNKINIKETPKSEVKDTSKIEIKESLKVEVKDTPKTEVKDTLNVKIDTEVKLSNTTRISESKIETNTQNKSIIENILQGMKTQKQTVTTADATSILANSSKEEIKLTENSEIKTETKTEINVNRTELKTQVKTDTIASKQLSPTKDTFNNFAAEFKEKIESYKPPFMRVQMALTPKGLGDVDVTIVNRGNNLHVNITSNTNTISLFTQNQAEFKNSLVNMGFTNLEMNFSDQRESKEQQNNNKSSKAFTENFEDENLEDETTSIELVVPQYV